jgi:hypothetical protein
MMGDIIMVIFARLLLGLVLNILKSWAFFFISLLQFSIQFIAKLCHLLKGELCGFCHVLLFDLPNEVMELVAFI